MAHSTTIHSTYCGQSKYLKVEFLIILLHRINLFRESVFCTDCTLACHAFFSIIQILPRFSFYPYNFLIVTWCSNYAEIFPQITKFSFLYGYTLPLNALIFIYINNLLQYLFQILHFLSLFFACLSELLSDTFRLSRHISFTDTFRYCLSTGLSINLPY